jgi:GT2 family glycosyltransferase
MQNKNRICTVVVTYNRKELLQVCLKSIFEQTLQPDEIYIVDNASTDGTQELLKALTYIDILPPENLKEKWQTKKMIDNIIVTYLKMPINEGGAGGFYEGMKENFEKNDWLWLMDDDGKPDKYCLKNLLNHKDKGEFLAPVVVDIEGKQELSFGVYDKVHNKKLHTYDDVMQNTDTGLYYDTASPFNGILLSSNMIEKIGFPIKGMFIWGDEAEYFIRAKHNGYRIVTISDAVHYHPKQRKEMIKIFNGKYMMLYEKNQLKYYCYIRNQTYRYKHYRPKLLFTSFLKYLWMFLITRKADFKGLKLFINAFKDGYQEDFTKHKNYLKV